MRKTNSAFLLIIAVFLFFSNTEMNAQQGNVQIQQNKKIEKLMEVKSELNKNNKIGDRFVIQLFYGDNGEASEVIQKYKTLYPYPSQITYEAPNYKVWVGNFRSRLEADRALLKVKENFPSAFIPKPQRK
ncbi:SPOR domain-containing protein [Christiangramia sp. SM2212]|uniref:SPOR domain-containing protein n=1 Tax=Christiangramia sediminicola TaxID=3073267 RepID=A0ABU1ELV6_9FLAO|nr:SPOR domain-containing protein [Christiangramia sp. SM2212]MDR5589360.1 SPOR domain-containing protein [Christiangramia sp. SM2212]